VHYLKCSDINSHRVFSTSKMLIEKRYIGWFCVWLVLAAVFAVVSGSVNWIRYYQLARHGMPTEGLVTSRPDPHNHGVSGYSYAVGQQTFTANDHPGAVEGQAITVFYLPADPTVSCPGDPHDLLRGESVPVGMACLLFQPLIVGSAYNRFGGRGKKASR
jgi:hypothetical protein